MVWILLPCAVISLLDNKELSPLICPFPWVYFPVDLFYVNALMDAVVAHVSKACLKGVICYHQV